MTTFVHRIDQNNPGDYWSCPSHYYTFNKSTLVDIKDISHLKTSDNIIFGGGGLLGRITWDHNIKKLTENNKVTLWGAGQNVYGQKKKGDMVGVYVESSLPDYMSNFSNIGLRDYGMGYNWVPCVSCMHPVFLKAKKIIPTNHVLGIEHNKIKLRSEFYPTINHAIQPKDLEDFILKIASYKYIITNTYHGAYWSLLLGKKVIIQPWSSKFNNLKWNCVAIGRNEHAVSSIIDLFDSIIANNETALEESIEANNIFYKSLDI